MYTKTQTTFMFYLTRVVYKLTAAILAGISFNKIYLQKKSLICGPPILQTGNLSKKTKKKKIPQFSPFAGSAN